VGLAVWGVLDLIQSRAIKKITDKELQAQLDQRARESLTRFDQYLRNYATTVRLLANHRSLAEYLEPLFWSSEDVFEPVVYRETPPAWLTDFIARSALPTPSHILLVDTWGRIRELYQSGSAKLPQEPGWSEGTKFMTTGKMHAIIARLDERPYLLVSDVAEDMGGYQMGRLIAVVPIDAEFLAASQRGLASGRAAVALVDIDEQRILASIDPASLPPDTRLSKWREAYLIRTQSLPQYEDTDWNFSFATFIPHRAVEKMSGRVRNFERQQRVWAALAYILVFTLVIYLVSARLNKILKRMAGFSRRALGIEHPGFRRGANQLILLDEWMRDFVQLVLKAREEMDRRHASEIRASEALKAAIMEASLDSIITLNRKGAIIELNPTAERTFGLARDQAIGQSFSRRFLTRDGRRLFLGLLRDSRRARREGRVSQARGQPAAHRTDGSEFPAELSIVPIQLDNRSVYTVYMHDITNRREAEREIKSLARFASESPNPILRVSPAGLVVYANAAGAPLLTAWGTWEGGRLPVKWTGRIGKALVDGRSLERETQIGDEVYSLLVVPIPELGYANIYGRDITAIRRAEQESRRHQAELVHVCRLSTMGEVATGMAHEINQPLSAIVNFANGCSRRLQGHSGQRQELVDAMGQITLQARRASEIIRRLRALVGKQPPIRSQVDLNHLVREVRSFVEFDTDKMDFTIELELWPGGITVDVDLIQIEQVLLNLVRNALDALQEIPPPARRLTLRTRLVGDQAEVRVRDSGPGIAPERMSSLFEPFFTTKESGMGMGLPISRTILENHEGSIRAESVPQEGATFRVRLPVAPAARPALAAAG